MEFDLDLELDKKYVTACCPVVYTGQVGTFQFRFLGTDAFSSENSRSLHPGPGPGEMTRMCDTDSFISSSQFRRLNQQIHIDFK